MVDNPLLEVIEKYLNGEMLPDERARFEVLRKENEAVNNAVTEHQAFTGLLKQYGERVGLENRLNAIHQEIDVHTLTENLLEHPSKIVQLWRNHHSKISVAASVALFVIVSVMYFAGSFNNNSDQQYVELSKKVNKLNQSNTNLVKEIHQIAVKSNPHIDKYTGTGTGFAITSDGLIATNYHVVKDVDSVYVQNADGKSFKAKVIYTEPQHDIAILKITDDDFENLGAIPYTFKRTDGELAEAVSTLGYPDGKRGYRNGYINAQSGLNGDSIHYQISIPITFGNSGGPLFDSNGNIIGITDAKQTGIEGEHLAIKSAYLLDAIHHIPADSLDEKPVLNRKNTLSHLNDAQRVKKATDYVFMVKTYN